MIDRKAPNSYVFVTRVGGGIAIGAAIDGHVGVVGVSAVVGLIVGVIWSWPRARPRPHDNVAAQRAGTLLGAVLTRQMIHRAIRKRR